MKKEIRDIGFIGLGRMGRNMVLNLLDKNYRVVAYNRTAEKVREIEKHGAEGAYSIKELADKLPERKVIWIMIKAGKPVDSTIAALKQYLKEGDIIIEGGNSFYRDSMRRYKELKKLGIRFLDCGVSGGVEGARKGACMMVGGDREAFEEVENIFRDMCVENGYAYVGSSGAGHFVKAVHNAIEYCMLSGLGEGFDTLEKNREKLSIDLKEVAKVYAHGSIIEGKLTKLLWEVFKESGIEEIAGVVPKGETEEEMHELEKEFNMRVLRESRLLRVRTRKKPSFAGKIIAALRKEFGGHKVFEEKTHRRGD